MHVRVGSPVDQSRVIADHSGQAGDAGRKCEHRPGTAIPHIPYAQCVCVHMHMHVPE